MPFASEKQRRFLFLHYPTIARKWAVKYTSPSKSGRRGSPRKRSRKVYTEAQPKNDLIELYVFFYLF